MANFDRDIIINRIQELVIQAVLIRNKTKEFKSFIFGEMNIPLFPPKSSVRKFLNEILNAIQSTYKLPENGIEVKYVLIYKHDLFRQNVIRPIGDLILLGLNLEEDPIMRQNLATLVLRELEPIRIEFAKFHVTSDSFVSFLDMLRTNQRTIEDYKDFLSKQLQYLYPVHVREKKCAEVLRRWNVLVDLIYELENSFNQLVAGYKSTLTRAYYPSSLTRWRSECLDNYVQPLVSQSMVNLVNSLL